METSRSTDSLRFGERVAHSEGPARGLEALLTSAWVDKLLAVSVIGLDGYFSAVITLWDETRNLDLVLMYVTGIVHYASALGRRPPTRVAMRPSYWLMANLGVYLVFLFAFFRHVPPASAVSSLIPPWVADALTVAAVALMAWGRVSLGRSWGIIPAHRGLVRQGVYVYVRHPIYSAMFVFFLARILKAFAIETIAIAVGGAIIYVVKAHLEERFLSSDPEYRAYMRAVRYRFVPYVY